jgi:hypothetical protein
MSFSFYDKAHPLLASSKATRAVTVTGYCDGLWESDLNNASVECLPFAFAGPRIASGRAMTPHSLTAEGQGNTMAHGDADAGPFQAYDLIEHRRYERAHAATY